MSDMTEGDLCGIDADASASGSRLLAAPRPWRAADSIVVLRAEVDATWPGRDKASDGTVGDTAHLNRKSDHAPWVPLPNGGVVTAVDITNWQGIGTKLAEHLRRLGAAGDRRVKYVIANRRIASALTGWKWVPYHGPNPHTTHIHLSVSETHYDVDAPWRVRSLVQQEEDDMDQRQFAEWLWNALHTQQVGRTGLSFAAVLDSARKDAASANDRAEDLARQLKVLQERVNALTPGGPTPTTRTGKAAE